MNQRLAVVTGANRGIGEEIARQLRTRELRVCATARRPTGDQQALDVRDVDDISRFAGSLEALDVLVNNAGVALQGFDARVAQETVETNYLGAARLTELLLPKLRPGARVVMVSSGLGQASAVSDALRRRFLAPDLTRAGLDQLVAEFVRDVTAGDHVRRGWPSSAYAVSKLAMNMLARILARELASDPRGILVNTACPGWVRTRMGGSGAPRSVEQGADTPVWLATLAPGGPNGGFFRDREQVEW